MIADRFQIQDKTAYRRKTLALPLDKIRSSPLPVVNAVVSDPFCDSEPWRYH